MYPATQAPPGGARADTASSRAVWGLGKFRMRNIGESLLNLVIDEEPKLLNGSDQKVSGRMWFFWLTTHRQSATGEQAGANRIGPVITMGRQKRERGKPDSSPRIRSTESMAGEPRGKLLGERVRERGESE